MPSEYRQQLQESAQKKSNYKYTLTKQMSFKHKDVKNFFLEHSQRDRQSTVRVNVTLRRVRATTDAVDKQ